MVCTFERRLQTNAQSEVSLPKVSGSRVRNKWCEVNTALPPEVFLHRENHALA